jgi:hypothetical protein
MADDPATLSIRVVELLRASLLEITLVDPPRGEIQATASLLETARVPMEVTARESGASPLPSPRPGVERSVGLRVSLGLGVSVLASPGELSPFPALFASGGLFASRLLHLGAFGALPLAAVKQRALEGTSEARVSTMGLEARLEPWRFAVRPTLAAGVAFTVLSVAGRGVRPMFRDGRDTEVSFGPHLRPGFALQLTGGIFLRGEATLGIVTRPIIVEYAGREVARWGRTWGAGALLLETRMGEQ